MYHKCLYRREEGVQNKKKVIGQQKLKEIEASSLLA